MSQTNQLHYPIIIFLSLATAPFLGSLLIFNQIAQVLGELGEVSEEVFRGDHLPILDFPADSSTNLLS